jgi:hypothetical protein
MKKLLVAAILAAGLPAFADGFGDLIKRNKTPQQTTPQPAPGSRGPLIRAPQIGAAASVESIDGAKRTMDVVEAELQAGKLYLTALNDLASKPTTWDQTSAIALFNDAQRSVSVAEEHMARLEPMAKDGWANAAAPIGRARATLVQTQAELRALANDVRSGTLTAGDPAQLKALWTTVDAAQKDLEGAAVTMGVDFHIKGF